MKKALVFLFILISISLYPQEKAKDQKNRLSQYIGNWLSTDHISDTQLSSNPRIMVKVVPRLDGNSLQVDVFEKRRNKWFPILVELISYDITTDQIDLYWMSIGEANPIEYINKYPGRFFSWHTKDDAEIGASGKVNFEQLFNYAKKAGLKYNVAEIEKYNFDPLISAEMGYRFLYYSDFVSSY